MQQTIQIFLKDLQNIRFLALISICFLSLNCLTALDTLQFYDKENLISLLGFLRVLIIYILLPTYIIQEDSLQSSDALWLSKPISGLRLLLAKILLIFLLSALLPAVAETTYLYLLGLPLSKFLLSLSESLISNLSIVLLVVIIAALTRKLLSVITLSLIISAILSIPAIIDYEERLTYSKPQTLLGLSNTHSFYLICLITSQLVLIIFCLIGLWHLYKTRYSSIAIISICSAVILNFSIRLLPAIRSHRQTHVISSNIEAPINVALNQATYKIDTIYGSTFINNPAASSQQIEILSLFGNLTTDQADLAPFVYNLQSAKAELADGSQLELPTKDVVDKNDCLAVDQLSRFLENQQYATDKFNQTRCELASIYLNSKDSPILKNKIIGFELMAEVALYRLLVDQIYSSKNEHYGEYPNIHHFIPANPKSLANTYFEERRFSLIFDPQKILPRQERTNVYLQNDYYIPIDTKENKAIISYNSRMPIKMYYQTKNPFASRQLTRGKYNPISAPIEQSNILRIRSEYIKTILVPLSIKALQEQSSK